MQKLEVSILLIELAILHIKNYMKTIKLKAVLVSSANGCIGCYNENTLHAPDVSANILYALDGPTINGESKINCSDLNKLLAVRGLPNCCVSDMVEYIYVEDKQEIEMTKNIPHKHYKEIIAWANGAKIEKLQLRVNSIMASEWVDSPSPSWSEDWQYRVKPEKKADIIRYCNPLPDDGFGSLHKYYGSNLKLTFDGETGKLIASEVLLNSEE